MRLSEVFRKAMLTAGTGVNAAEYTGGRAISKENNLDGKRRKRGKKREPPKCPACGTEVKRKDGKWICPSCGRRLETRKRK